MVGIISESVSQRFANNFISHKLPEIQASSKLHSILVNGDLSESQRDSDGKLFTDESMLQNLIHKSVK